MAKPHALNGGIAGPLDGVLRRHGATMVLREGRCVAAHFGSPTSEAAVCLSTVGIADRSDRTTFELRGAPPDIDTALAAIAPLGDRASNGRTGPRSAIARCDHVDTAACSAALVAADVAVYISNRFAAIQVIGPRAADLVGAFDERQELPAVVLDGGSSYELLVMAERGPALWGRLLDAGAPLRVACVGLEALERLAASHRLDRSASPTGSWADD
jgi:glycine cleavage system aminomethyltransferase T